MGKRKHNWKGRQVVKTVVDNSETNKIKVDFDVKGIYDESNALVLPSKKRKTTIKKERKEKIKILSNKQRKLLEKVVEKKAKKANRNSLLEALSQSQIAPEDFGKLTSITDIRTKGLKKYFRDLNKPEREQYVVTEEPDEIVKLSSLKGSKRKRIALVNQVSSKSNNPNALVLESSESDISLSDEDLDEDLPKEKIKKVEEFGVNASLKSNTTIDLTTTSNKDAKHINNEQLVLVPESDTKKESESQLHIKTSTVYVPVIRSESIQEARMKLPICAEEQYIMETIVENNIVIIAGTTGSGKTTQVPQFLYEAGYAQNKMIAITEPRRVAAISMSQRVAFEMNLTSKEVSYLIRFEGNVTQDTKIKFMTDGVLLKEIQKDFKLSKYSVVILDEAHERSAYTDLLIGFLSRIVRWREKQKDPLKLIVMSATLRLEDFIDNRKLFPNKPPVIQVESRQFEVLLHYNKRTNDNYLLAAFKKISKIHTQLPKGGILVFVTGQQEVNLLVKKLRKTFGKTAKNVVTNEAISEDGVKEEQSTNEKRVLLPKINLDDYSLPGDNEIESESDTDLENEEAFDNAVIQVPNTEPMWVLPLFSLLPSNKQSKVFEDPPEGYRLCVISTNVAETSLTIPNIKYVVDTGKTKIKLYDKVTGVSSYVINWTSKASADQRAGRAGRIGPGHCYRLYSSAVFNNEFAQYSTPEIQQKPIDDLYLQLKSMDINKVENFPFPTSPGEEQLKMAEKRLLVLNALEKSPFNQNISLITSLGRAISKFPVLPRFGKMLALSHQHNLIPYTICMVAALSVPEVLLETPLYGTGGVKEVIQKWKATRLKWAYKGNSFLLGDMMVLLRAVGAAEHANAKGKLEEFCNENGLRHKAIMEIRKLRIQLTNEINLNIPGTKAVVDPKMPPPSDLQTKLLRQILLAGMGDQIAKKVMPDDLENKEDKRKFKYAYKANNMEEFVFMHRSSVLRKKLPEFVVYQEIYETNKMYLRGIAAIECEWLPTYVPNLCNLKELSNNGAPTYNAIYGKIYCKVSGTFGTQAWQILEVEIEMPKNAEVFRWFAQFLLEGEVIPKLQEYKKHLLSPPSIIHKKWAHLHSKVDVFLNALMKHQVYTKELLLDAFEKNPLYLLEEYLNWLPASLHSSINLNWPPVE